MKVSIFNRLLVIAIFVSVVFLNVASVYSQDVQAFEEMSLVELATEVRPDFLLGTHISAQYMSDVPENAALCRIIANEYNLVSVGIYQRQTQRNSQEDWNLSSVDAVVDFAEENGLQVYAHPMFGSDGYLPDWLLESDFSNEELLEIIEDRIKIILTRYRGRIHILDVYNEGLSRSNGSWREDENLFLQLGWRENEYGRWPVLLEKMLVWCREYGGDDLIQIYNDNHNTLSGMPQSLECMNMFRALKEAGIPIDGIGIQCHTKITEEGEHQLGANSQGNGPLFDAESFARNMRSMGEAGIDVYVTECDVHLYGEIDADKLALQADAYRAILRACIEEPACRAFKTWGFSDASCWKPMAKYNRALIYEPCPLVFDHDFNPKPAYQAMHALLIQQFMEQQ